MTAVIARAAVVPLHVQPSLRTEQVSQLVLGECAEVLATEGEWRRVRGMIDGYEGWVHQGYVLETDAEAAARWQAAADGWSLGATVALDAGVLRLPLRARVRLDGGSIRLPDDRGGRVTDGSVARAGESTAAARRQPPEGWALEHFAGAPYEWGGVTPWGVDCSGLVQTTFAARGTALPRDAALQVRVGDPVAVDAVCPGDLVFFRGDRGPAITHVAFVGEGDTLIHSTVARGGVLQESWRPGTRAGALREKLEAARRLEPRV